jgi:hypothetical protein
MKHRVRYIVLIASVLLFGAPGSPQAETAAAEAFDFTAILVCTGPQLSAGYATGTVGDTGLLALTCSTVPGGSDGGGAATGSALSESFAVTLVSEAGGPPPTIRSCSFSGDGLPVHLTCRTDDHNGVQLQLIRH